LKAIWATRPWGAGAFDVPGAAQAVRAINQTKTAVIFTNQLRQKIVVISGSPETTTGGMALSSTPQCA
jgi:hypothetical protein